MGLNKSSPFAEAEWIPYIVILDQLFYGCAWFFLMPWSVFFPASRL
jgi:hypothetical protein